MLIMLAHAWFQLKHAKQLGRVTDPELQRFYRPCFMSPVPVP